MIAYRVVAACPRTALVALRDRSGRTHLGRAMTTALSPGASLEGESPAVGIRLMRLSSPPMECTVVLTLIDCDPAAAIKLIETLPSE